MSVRARPPVPKWGDPLPQLCDARTDQVVGHLIPVEGVALALSAETAHMHAFRRELAVAGAPPGLTSLAWPFLQHNCAATCIQSTHDQAWFMCRHCKPNVLELYHANVRLMLAPLLHHDEPSRSDPCGSRAQHRGPGASHQPVASGRASHRPNTPCPSVFPRG